MSLVQKDSSPDYSTFIVHKIFENEFLRILDFRLSPWFEYWVCSFGYFPGLLQFDAGEIPKRTYSIFKNVQRKCPDGLFSWNECHKSQKETGTSEAWEIMSFFSEAEYTTVPANTCTSKSVNFRFFLIHCQLVHLHVWLQFQVCIKS